MFKSQNVLPGDPSNIHMLDGTVLYAGSIPFMYSLNVYLQKIDKPSVQWYITIHLIADGTVQRVFESQTVEIYSGQVVPVPFPTNTQPPVQSNAYGVNSVTATYNGQVSVPQSIAVLLTDAGPGTYPVLEIIDTSLTPTWLIGARNIILTDPPLYSPGDSTTTSDAATPASMQTSPEETTA